MEPARLSLGELQRFDPDAPARGTERRFCCPYCGHHKRRDPSHRSLAANTESGEYLCHRCQAKGMLTEFLPEKPATASFVRNRPVVNEKRGVIAKPAGETYGPITAQDFDCGVPDEKPAGDWRKNLKAVVPLKDTPGAGYLEKRGIPWDLAMLAGVRFSADWYGRPAVVFPVRDGAGALVAAQGRYIQADAKPKVRDCGAKKLGIFSTVGAWDGDEVILCEAPIDALSLTVGGYPAIAALGCQLAEFVADRTALRRVLVATDADEAGDRAAAEWAVALQASCARCLRLRPPAGVDWNALLLRLGAEAFGAKLDEVLRGDAGCSEEADGACLEK